MQKTLQALGGMSSALRPDPLRVRTPEQLNAHIDSIIDHLQKLKIATEPEPADPPELPELGPDRQERKGRVRVTAPDEDES